MRNTNSYERWKQLFISLCTKNRMWSLYKLFSKIIISFLITIYVYAFVMHICISYLVFIHIIIWLKNSKSELSDWDFIFLWSRVFFQKFLREKKNAPLVTFNSIYCKSYYLRIFPRPTLEKDVVTDYDI